MMSGSHLWIRHEKLTLNRLVFEADASKAGAPPTIDAKVGCVTQRQGAALKAEAKLRQAMVASEAKLQKAMIRAEAKLRRAKKPAEEKLQQALVEAEVKLRQALVEADAKLRQAEGPAEAKVQRALVEAEEKLKRAAIQADEKLRQAQQELAYQRDVFERFFALSLDMMSISSSDGYFTRVSPSFDALGYTHDELLSRPALDFVHPDDRAKTQEQLAKLVSGMPTITFENRFRCKDGSYRWLSWVSGPDSVGTMYSMARDVTDAKHKQEELAHAKDVAEAMNRELESFSYSVAHDLRSPLRSIDGFSQALLEDYVETLDAEGKKYLAFIRESAQHMAELIDDLLGLSRVTRSNLHREDVDLTALAHAAVSRLRRSQPDRRVEIVIAEGLRDQGDSHLLAVALDNLFGNAWKFTSKRLDGRIEFGTTLVGDRKAYFVRDNGVGFDMAFASKLFGVFQRLHTTSEFEGTGVGLATVQRVVSRHDGHTWAEAKVNDGATFYFTLYEKGCVYEQR